MLVVKGGPLTQKLTNTLTLPRVRVPANSGFLCVIIQQQAVYMVLFRCRAAAGACNADIIPYSYSTAGPHTVYLPYSRSPCRREMMRLDRKRAPCFVAIQPSGRLYPTFRDHACTSTATKYKNTQLCSAPYYRSILHCRW